MSAIKTVISSSLTTVTATGLSTLANATFLDADSPIDLGTPTPIDCIFELAVTPGTVSGNKQVRLYVQYSLDGTNYTTGPVSGTTATDEPNLYQIGAVPVNTNSTAQRKSFSVKEALGFCPRYINPVVMNDSGAALSAGTLKYTTVIGDVQ